VAAAAQELAAARREYGQISDIRLQLQLEQARTRLAEAVRVVGELTQLSAREELEADAWDAVNAVLDTEVARQERDSAQAAYAGAHAGLGPLRARVATAAAALAGRLDGLISEAGAAARAADELVIASQDAQDRALENEKTAERARDQARR